MEQMDPRISFITLGVSDLRRATNFYEDVLKLPKLSSTDSISFFSLGPTRLALYPRLLLAEDAGVPVTSSGFSGVALAHNVRSKEEVDALLQQAIQGGARLTRAAHATTWGGYSGYFADPDGFLWEIAWNPNLSIPD